MALMHNDSGNLEQVKCVLIDCNNSQWEENRQHKTVFHGVLRVSHNEVSRIVFSQWSVQDRFLTGISGRKKSKTKQRRIGSIFNFKKGTSLTGFQLFRWKFQFSTDFMSSPKKIGLNRCWFVVVFDNKWEGYSEKSHACPSRRKKPPHDKTVWPGLLRGFRQVRWQTWSRNVGVARMAHPTQLRLIYIFQMKERLIKSQSTTPLESITSNITL